MQWEAVPEIDQNGQIIAHEVRFGPAHTVWFSALDQYGRLITEEVRVGLAQLENVSYMNVSGSDLVLVVDGLEEFVEYDFDVRAYTIAGPGPHSVITTSTTDQAGEKKSFECGRDSLHTCNL